jgi:hypothetical protein
MFLGYNEDKLKHLRKTFRNSKKFGLSLNPKDSYFAMMEGNLLGHIVPKEGFLIYLERVEVIKLIFLPRNKK